MALSLRRWPFWLLGAVVLLGGALAGWYLWQPPPPRPPALKLDGIEPTVVLALQDASKAVEASPRSARAWGKLAELLLANDLIAESLECLRQAERLEPGEARWPYLQGFALLLSEPEGAVAPLTRATEIDPRGLTPRLRLAEVLLERDDLAEAESQYKLVLDLDPDNSRALLGLGQIAQRREHWADSVALLKQAAASPYAQKAAHTALALTYLRLHDEVAAEHARQEADAAPRDPPWPDPYMESIQGYRTSLFARLERAHQATARQEYSLAVRLFQEILEDEPGCDEARLNLAQAYIRVGQPGQAEKELRALVAQYPKLPDGHSLLGVVLLQWRKGSEAEAEAEIRRAIELRPGFALAYYNLGRCLQQQGKIAPARQAYEDALRSRPQLVIAHVALARLLLHESSKPDDRAAAREHLQQALKLQPGEPEALKLLEEEKPR